MTTTDSTTEILNDLIAIHNDRITGYEKALKELEENGDSDLRSVFLSMIDESREMKMQLGNEVQVGGATIESDNTTLGKIYQAWMDIKATFTGHNRKSILSSCEYGEDAAQKAYTSTLNEEGIPKHIREMLQEQQASLKTSHDEIKSLRDMAA